MELVFEGCKKFPQYNQSVRFVFVLHTFDNYLEVIGTNLNSWYEFPRLYINLSAIVHPEIHGSEKVQNNSPRLSRSNSLKSYNSDFTQLILNNLEISQDEMKSTNFDDECAPDSFLIYLNKNILASPEEFAMIYTKPEGFEAYKTPSALTNHLK